MKKFVLTVFALAVVFGSPYLAAADTIEVRADTWMPYNGDPASDRPGYCVELLKAVFGPAGHTIDYQVMPWTRDVADAQSDKIDAIIGASFNDCPKCLFPKESAGKNQNFFYVKKGDTWIFNGLDSLKTKHLGVIDGYAYDDGKFDDYIKNGSVPYVQKATGDDALDHNIKKLSEGRLDILAENPLVFKEALTRLGLPLDAFVPAGIASPSQDVFIAFAPGKDSSGKYLQIWDEGIKKLRGSGKFKEILDRYGIADWE